MGKRYTPEELKRVLKEHRRWIESDGKQGARASLCGADLCGADLCGASLRFADLGGADLRFADLRFADLCCADLCCADLCCADLCCANLRDADLRGAGLGGASLPDRTFVILGEEYFVSIANGDHVRVGCRSHTVDEWRSFTREEVQEMDAGAISFAPRLLDILDFYCGPGGRPAWVGEVTSA